jgi:hypothetical protein
VAESLSEAVYQAIVHDSLDNVDKGVAFTASLSGAFTVRVSYGQQSELVSSNPVTISVNAVGTARERSSRVEADDQAHAISVKCHLSSCAFGYDGTPALDGDGSGFELVLANAEAGRSYAILVHLPLGQSGSQVALTFYQVGAAAAAAGFPTVVDGPLGEWTATPGDSLCTDNGYDDKFGDGQCDDLISSGTVSCSADLCATCGDYANYCDRSCENVCTHESYFDTDTLLPASFGVHPGGQFGSYLAGTWVAPASGPVMLRLALNCDVVFFADVEAAGCTMDNPATGEGAMCVPNDDGVNNAVCTSELMLTVTPGAYYESDGHRRVQSDGSDAELYAPSAVHGTATRIDTIELDRASVEAQAAAKWQSTPTDHRATNAPPVLDEMLTGRTAANDLLTSLFNVHQQPLVVFPTIFDVVEGKSTADGIGRRLQQQGGLLQVTVETHAPSIATATQAEKTLVARLPGAVQGHRRRLHETVCTGGDCPLSDDGICGLSSTDRGCTSTTQAKQSTAILVSRADIETIAQNHDDAMSLARTPTLDDMLVGGSEANALLASIFVDTQHPLSIVPTGFTTHDRTSSNDGRRQLQAGGDVLRVRVETHAATSAQALQGVQHLARRLQGTVVDSGACDLPTRTQSMHDECCDEKTEDCSPEGVPASSCNAGCADILLPFFADCADQLEPTKASQFNRVVSICQETLDSDGGGGDGYMGRRRRE